jgi:hypothetical protein
MYNALFVPSATGLQLARSSSAGLELRVKAGVAQATVGNFDDTPREASAKRHDAGDFMMSGAGANTRSNLTFKTRRLATHSVGGKRISLAIVPDEDVRSRRPPKAMVILVNDRIAAISEYRYARKAGAWRAIRSRTTFLDTAGTVTLAVDNDLSQLTYRRDDSRLGAVPGLKKAAGALRTGLTRLALPDALYAATPRANNEEACWEESLAVVGANALFLAAGVAVVAARNAVAAAATALVTATGLCMADPATCPAVPAAAAALTAAQLGETKAWAQLGAASTAVIGANSALAACLWPSDPSEPTDPGGGSGGGGGGGGDAECDEWCQWTVSFSGDRLNVTTDYCWCEKNGDADL